MSVLIKGLDMPKDGKCVHLSVRSDGKPITDYTGKWADYEVVEIPPHGRLIDADALMTAEFGGEPYKGSINRVLIQAPTIIPADKEEQT